MLLSQRAFSSDVYLRPIASGTGTVRSGVDALSDPGIEDASANFYAMVGNRPS